MMLHLQVLFIIAGSLLYTNFCCKHLHVLFTTREILFPLGNHLTATSPDMMLRTPQTKLKFLSGHVFFLPPSLYI